MTATLRRLEGTALAEGAGLLELAVEHAADVVVVTDLDGTITYANPAFERTTGYSREEAVGQNPRLVKSGAHDLEFYRELWGTITSGRVWSGRMVNRRKDGSLYTEQATIAPFRGPDGEPAGYVAVKRDVTAEVRLTEELLRADKLDALGAMAGGLAHDVNNGLAAVMILAKVALRKVGAGEDPTADLEAIVEACRHGRALTEGLVAFSGKAGLPLRPLSVNAVVRGAATIVDRTSLGKVRVELDLAEDLPAVKGDAARLSQALVNLCMNAAEAMPDGGVVTVSTRWTAAHPSSVDATRARPEWFVLVSVGDSGEGMDEQTRARAFEPFFTTKRGGSGSGLGLSAVYGTARAHGGVVEIDSAPGQGTTVTLRLPALGASASFLEPAADAAARAAGADAAPPADHEGHRVLVVDDDAMILEALAGALEREGYLVLTASGGEEALEACRAHGGEISGVVLDLVMPGMDGYETLARLRELAPDLPVLVCSGRTERRVVEEVLALGASAFVAKPFSLDELTARLDDLLL